MRYSLSLFALSMFLIGCSGQTFGPARHPLLKTAKYSRQDGPPELPRELSKVAFPPYTVEPGDGLLLLPTDLDSPVRLPADQTILPDGTIDLGRYGHLEVIGRTIPEIEQLVKLAVLKITADAGFIDVRLVNRQSKLYYVVGEVQTPGKFTINGNETVLDGILQAGGPTDRASLGNVILARPAAHGCGLVLRICYSEIVQLGDVSTNYQLQPGDRIFVPSKSFWEQLTGNAEK